MKIMSFLRLISALPLAGYAPHMMPITAGYRSRQPVSSYILYGSKDIFGAFQELFGSLNALIARLYSVVRRTASSILRVFASFLSLRGLHCFMSLRMNEANEVSEVISEIFAKRALTAEKIGKTKEDANKGSESSKKIKVIKTNIFIQNTFAENNFDENISIEKCFEAFRSRKGFSKANDFQNEDKNNFAKKDLPIKLFPRK